MMETKWISIKDKLPDEQQNVLVTSGNEPYIAKLDRFDPSYLNELTWYIQGAPWRGGNWGTSLDKSNVTHWMPLPNPPKTEEK